MNNDLEQEYSKYGIDLSEIERYCGKVDLFILYLSDSIIGNATSTATIEEVIEDVNMDKQKMVLVGEKDYLAEEIDLEWDSAYHFALWSEKDGKISVRFLHYTTVPHEHDNEGE